MSKSYLLINTWPTCINIKCMYLFIILVAITTKRDSLLMNLILMTSGIVFCNNFLIIGDIVGIYIIRLSNLYWRLSNN